MDKKIPDINMVYRYRFYLFVLFSPSEIITKFPKISIIILHCMWGIVFLELKITNEGVYSFFHSVLSTNTTDS